MDSMENLVFAEIIPNKCLFCVELLSYPKFLNTGLTLQALG